MTSKHGQDEPKASARRVDGRVDRRIDTQDGQDGPIDRRIDQVLAGLRAAEPDDGMERRLLAAVRQRGAEATAPRRRAFARFRIPRWAWAAPATALVLSCVLWVLHGPELGGHTAAPKVSLMRAHVAATTEATRPEVGETTTPEPRAGSSEPLRRARSAAPPRVATTVALVNHPAPEAPLTDEERMLLRIANHSRPDDLAVLNPDARDAQAKADSAEFRKFFGPPPTGDRE